MTASAAPTVCVALSVRDGGVYLAEAIESVLAQEDVALELRIYDNGSTDGSFDVYARYDGDPRVIVAQNPEGAHFYTSMNRALAETQAMWFVPWCADDVMLPRNLAGKLAAAADADARLVCAPVVSLDGAGRPGKLICNELGDRTRVFDPPSLFPEISPWNRVALPGILAATAALREVGGFDTRLRLVGDWMMWLHLALRVRSIYIPEPGVLYREHAGNTTSGARRAGTFASELVAAFRAIHRDPAFPAELRFTFREHLIEILSGQAYSHLGSGLVRVSQCPRPAYALAFEALLLDPSHGILAARFDQMVQSAELPRPRLPANVVAAPLPGEDDVESTMRSLRTLLAAPQLVRRVQIAVRPGDADAMIALIEDELARHGDVDVELTVVEDPLSLLRPGDIFVARDDDPRAPQAERECGATVFPRDVADPLAGEVTLPLAA